MMARAIEQVAALGRVQVEEDARHDDDLLLEAGLEEVEAVADGVRQAAEVEPDVEGAVGDVPLLEDEADLLEAAEDEVTLGEEVRLQRAHLAQDFGGLEHGDGGFLEGDVGAAVEVGAAAADGFDELLGADDPGDAPAREAEAFGETLGYLLELSVSGGRLQDSGAHVYQENVVFVYILPEVSLGR